MASNSPRRTRGEIAAILEQLQLLADDPQLRHRLGYGRLSAADLPFADSRRPIDPRDGYRWRLADIAAHNRDADENYGRGLL
jgi:hypothetical protein